MATLEAIANSTFPAIPHNVAAKTGPRILGYLFHWGLFGALCVQVYLYYLAFPRDPLRTKLAVYSVFVLEVTQTVMMTYTCFHAFGFGYGNLNQFNVISIGWISAPLITGFVAFIAQLFYAYRISVLARSYTMAGVIVFLAFVQLGGSIASAHILKTVRLFSHLLGKQYSIAAGVWNGASALCDLIIAVCMTYYLSRRGEGTMSRTQILLKRIIRLVIETGVVTAAMALLHFILSILPGQPSYYLVTSETLAKFYSNSMMVVLNSRIQLGVESSSSIITTTSEGTTLGKFRSKVLSRGGAGTDTYELNEGVTITTEELMLSDSDVHGAKNNKGYLV